MGFDTNSTKKAMIIGINYPNTQNSLRGCGTDAKNFYDLLTKEGFSTAVLCDAPEAFTSTVQLIPPTRNQILSNLRQLVKSAKAGDTIFLTYSGHGTQMAAKAGAMELDGKSEFLIPSDAMTNPQQMAQLIIGDFELNEILQGLPAGVNFIGITDGCHTGSIFNFPGNLDEQTRDLSPKRYAAISGCQDRQTSADAWLDGKYQGALSASLMSWVKDNTLNKMISILLSTSLDEKRVFQNQLISWLSTKKFEQRPNISFEIPGLTLTSMPGVKPTPTTSSPVKPTQTLPTITSPVKPSQTLPITLSPITQTNSPVYTTFTTPTQNYYGSNYYSPYKPSYYSYGTSFGSQYNNNASNNSHFSYSNATGYYSGQNQYYSYSPYQSNYRSISVPSYQAAQTRQVTVAGPCSPVLLPQNITAIAASSRVSFFGASAARAIASPRTPQHSVPVNTYN